MGTVFSNVYSSLFYLTEEEITGYIFSCIIQIMYLLLFVCFSFSSSWCHGVFLDLKLGHDLVQFPALFFKDFFRTKRQRSCSFTADRILILRHCINP